METAEKHTSGCYSREVLERSTKYGEEKILPGTTNTRRSTQTSDTMKQPHKQLQNNQLAS